MLKLRFGSLTLRVIMLSTMWAIIAMVAIATIISSLFREASERGFESLLSAHLFNLISTVSVSDDGNLQGTPNLGDLLFTVPRSGWYWSVEPVSDNLGGQLRSLSMVGSIDAPPTSLFPFNLDFQRRYIVPGLAGEQIEVFETEVVLDNQNRIARFRVMGNRTDLEREIDGFDGQLYFYLALFGVGMIIINAIAIFVGLAPLTRVRRALSDIRSGSASRLDGKFPAEIAPLAAETNALIDSNRRIVERSRTQVGNLAHSLKTPLAVLLNEGRAIGGQKGAIVIEQASAMESQIGHYLQRARIAAQRDTVVFRTPVVETLERLVRVMEKLNPRIDLAFNPPEREIVFAGEKEDFEELTGNILENAMKWARSEVSISLVPVTGGSERMFDLVIEDDGPGIPEQSTRDALKRGKRLDETKPGTGLGLSIVSDLVKEYGGTLELDRSALGGLRVTVQLRMARE